MKVPSGGGVNLLNGPEPRSFGKNNPRLIGLE
jgi:hypothetical protein